MTDAQNTDNDDITHMSAQNTDALEEAPDPNGPADPAATNGNGFDDDEQDVDTRTYEDDFDAEDSATDPFIDEATEDPTKTLQVPPNEFKDELDGIALDDLERDGSEDMRETMEDRDEDDDNSASGA